MKKLVISALLAVGVVGLGYPVHAEPAAAAKTRVNWNTGPLKDSKKVEFKTLPIEVREAVHKHIGNNSHVEDVDKGMLNGRVVYELAYKKDKHSNKTYEVRIAPDGTVLGEHAD
jgi:hypothetical protein